MGKWVHTSHQRWNFNISDDGTKISTAETTYARSVTTRGDTYTKNDIYQATSIPCDVMLLSDDTLTCVGSSTIFSHNET